MSDRYQSEAYEHLRTRAFAARAVLDDADATFERLDLAARSLGDLSRQMADITWPDPRYVALYEQIRDWRVAVLERMAATMH